MSYNLNTWFVYDDENRKLLQDNKWYLVRIEFTGFHGELESVYYETHKAPSTKFFVKQPYDYGASNTVTHFKEIETLEDFRLRNSQ